MSNTNRSSADRTGRIRRGRRRAERELDRDHQQEIAEALVGDGEQERCAINGCISDELDGEGCCPGCREEMQASE